jgi:uncharacterized membrane protein
MRPQSAAAPGQSKVAAPVSHESEQVDHNIAAVNAFYARDELKRSAAQRHAESLSSFIGRPVFLIAILVFVSLWIGVNLALPAFDPAPFFWLQGALGLAALLTTTIVLIKQNRIDKLDEQRAHLDLKMTLLIERKTAKIIDLIEELRRDLPNVNDRHDSGAFVMKNAISPEGVLAALDEKIITDGTHRFER